MNTGIKKIIRSIFRCSFAHLYISIIFIALGCSSSKPPVESPPEKVSAPLHAIDTAAQATAQLLAGICPDNDEALRDLCASKGWKAHSREFSAAWEKFDAQKLEPVRNWSKTALADVSPATETLFYPFSGPDFIYAHTFVPTASRYLLFGLEPVGSIPDLTSMSPAELTGFLAILKRSFREILSYSYFITHKMSRDIRSRSSLDGVTPILMTMIAREGLVILSVRRVALSGEDTPSRIHGVEIVVVDTAGARHEIVYFQIDISNGRRAKNKAFYEYLDGVPEPVTTFVKSASYIMHDSYFSDIRSAILEKSTSIVQDDTGIPYRFLPRSQWDVQLYGRYAKPIRTFEKRFQPDLKRAYRDSDAVRFRYGYNKESNFLVAARKAESPDAGKRIKRTTVKLIGFTCDKRKCLVRVDKDGTEYLLRSPAKFRKTLKRLDESPIRIVWHDNPDTDDPAAYILDNIELAIK